MAIWVIADVCNVKVQLSTPESGDDKLIAKVTPSEKVEIIESETVRSLVV